MNSRRKFIVALGASALVSPLSSLAQPQTRVWRIGILANGSSISDGFRIDAFVKELAKIGYVEGNNIFFMIRFADGNPDRLPTLAADLVAKNVDVVLATNTLATRAANRAIKNIPIVFAVVGDPVGFGLVASLAKPGGNITGLSTVATELSAKRLQLLKEILPKIARVAIIAGDAQTAQIAEAERAAKALGMQTLAVQLERRQDVKQLGARLKEWRADSLDFLEGGTNFYHRKLLIEFAATMHLPAIAATKEYAEDGALISYGANIESNYLRAATYVDKILKGAKPGDLPVEQPTQFEMVINMKTAKALGVKIPSSILARADKVIE